jgi:hypothetical protein
LTTSGVRHVVMFRWSDDVTEDQWGRVSDALAGLPGLIPQIRAYRFGPDLGVNEGNHDYVVVADFDSVADYLIYRDHPSHRAVVTDIVAPLLAGRAAVQYALGA